MHQDLAHQVARHDLGRPLVESARHKLAPGRHLFERHGKINLRLMRLFTAIDLPREIVDRLDALISELRPLARIRWSPASNLHITVKFIGRWPDERVEELKSALAGLPGRAPVPIRISGLGYFPNLKSPRVFWAGVDASPDLARLAAETDVALEKLGVEPEKRRYSPHLTLARIAEPAQARRLPRDSDARDFGAFTADRFYLYLSEPHPSGSVYTKLSEFPFKP
jgi:2'-5' RNA ligase